MIAHDHERDVCSDHDKPQTHHIIPLSASNIAPSSPVLSVTQQLQLIIQYTIKEEKNIIKKSRMYLHMLTETDVHITPQILKFNYIPINGKMKKNENRILIDDEII